MIKKHIFLLILLISFAACGIDSSTELPLLTSYDFENGKSEGWKPNFSECWEIADLDGSTVYALTASGESGDIAAPKTWSILTGHDVTSFEFTGRLKCMAEIDNPNRDLCIFFHYLDPTHFYYVHFSARSDERHNIIGLVNGADRIKINVEPAGMSVFRLTDREWHSFKVTYDEETGKIAAYLDDLDTPILTASGSVLGHGLVGIGSYDDIGFFDDILLQGKK